MAYTVARRLAIIEASIWREFGQVKHKMPTFSKLQGSQAAAVKRKLEDAIDNTNGETGCHSTFQWNGWTRCRDCSSFARPGNKDAWARKLRTRRFKRPRTQVVAGGALELVQGFREYVRCNPPELEPMLPEPPPEQPVHVSSDDLMDAIVGAQETVEDNLACQVCLDVEGLMMPTYKCGQCEVT